MPGSDRPGSRDSPLAMCTRIALLYSIVWLTHLTRPLIELESVQLSGRDLILLGGGLFLLAKSVSEIHHALEGAARGNRARPLAGFVMTVIQIGLIDIVFSLDSVFVAVGLARSWPSWWLPLSPPSW